MTGSRTHAKGQLGTQRTELLVLANKYLMASELDELARVAGLGGNVLEAIVSFDQKLGGVGLHNVETRGGGRYDIEDRDIFRPLQYIRAYFSMDGHSVQWVTREIVHMCGLHLESMVKRLTGAHRVPLGRALTLRIARLRLSDQTVADLGVIVGLYNEAKHGMDQEKDTHLFDVHTALICYAVTRKLAMSILPLTNAHVSNLVEGAGSLG